MVMAQSMREALEAAWDKVEGETEETVDESVEEVVEEEEVAPDPEPEPIVEEEEVAGDEPAEEEEPAEEPPLAAEAQEEEPELKAPGPWKPAAREHWASIPREVQQEILRREKDAHHLHNETAEDRKYAKRFRETIEPFRAVMQAEGADEFQAVQNIGRFVQSMRLGTPQEKATLVADIIKSYGVDIGTLDRVLIGEEIPEEQRAVHDLIQREIRPLKQEVEMWRQRAEQAAQTQNQQVEQTIDEFAAGHEFYNDVELDMADLLDMAARRGQAMTLDQAYERACWANPDVRQVMESRQRTTATTTPAEALAKRKAAASSLRPSRSNGAGQTAPDSTTTRGALEAAWAKVESGEI